MFPTAPEVILGASQTVCTTQGLPDPVCAAEAEGKSRQPVQRQRLPLSKGKTTLQGFLTSRSGHHGQGLERPL